jgi:hypothetical protein
MAKRSKRQKRENSTVLGAKTAYQGIGYHIPHGYTLKQIQQLASEWNLKLQKSNHADIEHFSDVLMGLSAPFLKGTKTHKAYEAHHDPTTALNYIQTYINFYMHTKAAQHRYKADWQASLFLLDCYVNQVEFRDIASLAVSADYEAFAKLYPNVEIPKRFDASKLYKSHYWAYQRTRKLLQHCWLWHITDQNGEITPDELTTYGFVGLDVKGTTEYYNKELAKLGKPPIKIRKPESKY